MSRNGSGRLRVVQSSVDRRLLLLGVPTWCYLARAEDALSAAPT